MVMPDLEHSVVATVHAQRVQRKWRQADLSQRLGWPTWRLSDLEVGRRGLRVNELVPLCSALDISLAELIRDADPADLAALQVDPPPG